MKFGCSDENQAEIVDYFRSKGFSVFVASAMGKGFPDLVVGYSGYNYLIEVKNPEGASTHTAAQVKFAENWNGQYTTVRSIDDVDLFLESINYPLCFLVQLPKLM